MNELWQEIEINTLSSAQSMFQLSAVFLKIKTALPIIPTVTKMDLCMPFIC